jgi:hypothetical protein
VSTAGLAALPMHAFVAMQIYGTVTSKETQQFLEDVRPSLISQRYHRSEGCITVILQYVGLGPPLPYVTHPLAWKCI